MKRINVKICGVKNLDIAQVAIENKIAMLGFNFVPTSKRYIDPTEVKSIIQKVKGKVRFVGIFQDASIEEVNSIVKDLHLDFVQLHGDESPEYCRQIKVPIIKKINLEKSSVLTEKILDQYRPYVRMFLVDRPLQGKGAMVNLSMVNELSKKYSIMLAGGLTIENIDAVLRSVGDRLVGIDINSGVEEKPGEKNNALVNTFMDKIKAIEMDRKDPLRMLQQEFYVPKDTIYLDGNSLGLFSKKAEKSLYQVVHDYKRYGIDGFTKGEYPGFYMAEKIGEMISSLLGALPEEVIIAGSTTVNIHQMIATFFKPKGKRKKILIDCHAFPTDKYAIQSQLLLHGLDPIADIVIVGNREEDYVKEEDIISAMSDEIALILLPVAFYKSGQILDVKRLTQEAHKRNILIGFDGCHSVGILPHDFHNIGVDFAVFCTYKYLNGGPGAPAGLFVHRNHFGTFPGLAGWFGSDKEKQFDMLEDMIPAKHAGAYQMGTPHIFSMAPLIGSLSLMQEVGIDAIRKKSLELTEYMIELSDTHLKSFGFLLITPRDVTKRGGHISLSHTSAASICKALKERNIIPDFRPPHIIRFAPVPFYTTFLDVYKTIEVLEEIMRTRTYMKYTNTREVIA